MDFQFFGANCVTIGYKSTRIVVDDNLESLGKKSVVKSGDIVLLTNTTEASLSEAKIVIDCPGEYEVADISIVGIPARSHMDEEKQKSTTMYKITTNDIDVLITGHIYPKLSDNQLEKIGICDVVILPVGGHGYTLDSKGALDVIKEIEPKLVIPTHYDIKGINYPVPQTPITDALKEMGMEPKETTPKLKLKASDLAEVTQLVVLEAN